MRLMQWKGRAAAVAAVTLIWTVAPGGRVHASEGGSAQALAGRWDALVTLGGSEIPFRLDVSGDGATLTGTLFNGDLPQTTSSASYKDGTLTLEFAHYLTTITATAANGQLGGQVEGRFGAADQYISAHPFKATRHVAPAAAATPAPSIAGDWIIPFETNKGEKSWRLVVQQQGDEVSAAILRVDGDTGSLTGRWRDGHFLISHFDGSRPLVQRITLKEDGSLRIEQTGAFSRRGTLEAFRVDVASAKGIAAPADFVKHTTVRDANEVFSFDFPDLDGRRVSSTDPRFAGKVVIAVVTGTWCPNCHDEAQYLVQLDKKYRDKGLAIVALNFEEPEQQDELARARAFVKKYGVQYTYVLAGAPVEMWEKVPQLVNLNTWPATVFVGRDGRVRKIHAGFASPASGKFHDQLRTEFTSTIEQLLAEPAPVSRAESAQARAGER